MKKFELKVKQDHSPESPREWDNITTMICLGKYGYLGDKHNYKRDNFDSWDELKTQIETDYNVLMIKPLYVYEHSGITISTSPNSCRFDTSFVGFIFIDEKQWIQMMGEDMDRSEDRLNRIIDSEVETYDKYITGEVYGYEVYEVETCDKGHEHKTLVESCWGFYDEGDCESEGQSMIEHLEKEFVS